MKTSCVIFVLLFSGCLAARINRVAPEIKEDLENKPVNQEELQVQQGSEREGEKVVDDVDCSLTLGEDGQVVKDGGLDCNLSLQETEKERVGQEEVVAPVAEVVEPKLPESQERSIISRIRTARRERRAQRRAARATRHEIWRENARQIGRDIVARIAKRFPNMNGASSFYQQALEYGQGIADRCAKHEIIQSIQERNGEIADNLKKYGDKLKEMVEDHANWIDSSFILAKVKEVGEALGIKPEEIPETGTAQPATAE